MSRSQHPVALSAQQRVGRSWRLLAAVMALPLVDGVFVSVVLGGALDSVVGIVEVGLLVFAGSATVAVILAEMDESPREQVRVVLGVGAVVIVGAAVVAALAPAIESAIEMAVFERFAALVVLAVAATTASSRVGEYLPGPALIVALGVVASLSPAEAALAVQTDPWLIGRAAAAAGVGVGFALVVAATSPWLRAAVELDRFRFGSAVALGVLALSIVGLVPANAPVALVVLVVTAALSFDPGQARSGHADPPDNDLDATATLSDGGRSVPAQDTADESGTHETPDRPPWF